MLPTLHKIIRAILILTPIFILGWLTAKELMPSGRVGAVYNMQRETPFISKLYPRDRVSAAKENLGGENGRVILAEPVYFDLKPSDKFEKVTIAVKYKNSGEVPLKMGPLVNKKDWLFDWRDLASGGVGWQTQSEVFDFSRLAPEGQKYRIGFSAVGLQPGQIEIGEIKVFLERKPLSEKEVANKILNAIIWRLNRFFEKI